MTDIDNLLQQKLEALEGGAPLETLLDGPEAGDELASLLQLASNLRALPGPQTPAPATGPALHTLEGAWPLEVEKRKNGAARGQAAPPTRPEKAPARTLPQRPARQLGRVPLFGVGTALLVVFALVAVLAGAGLWLAGPAAARQATLLNLEGQVQVASPEQPEKWWAASTGEQVRAGWRIRTGPASGVTLKFYDGTLTTLGQGTELTLKELGGGWNRSLRVEIVQQAGKTAHSVVPLRGEASRFIVQSPAGQASVHGTRFEVLVAGDGRSRFAVDSGKVQVSSGGQEVFLLPGQVTLASTGEGLEEPSHEFSLQGELGPNLGSLWVVAGVPVTVLDGTLVGEGVEPGQLVSVAGHILASGEWVADEIAALPPEVETVSAFSGVLEAQEGETWTVNGRIVIVDAATQLSPGLKVGDRVRVQFTLLPDGRWLAEGVLSLETLEEDLDGEPVETPNADAEPVLVFSPDTLEFAGCQDGQIVLDGLLVNTASGEEDVAADVRLGFEILQGAEQIEVFAVSPGFWEEIPAGGQEPFTLQVVPEAGWCSQAAGDPLLAEVFVASERNAPSNHLQRLSLTLQAEEGPGETTVTPTPSLTPVMTETLTSTPVLTATLTLTPTLTATQPVSPTVEFTPTPTQTPTPEATPTPGAGPTGCTGAQPHPKGTALAQKYGVPYEEIMGWFCQGFGFGEIDQAYALSQQSGVPVEEIFAMRNAGSGWGEIKKLLSGQGEEPGPGNSGGKPEDKPGKPEDKPGNPGGKPDKEKKPRPTKKP